MEISVAGVTFANDDGMNRQDILKQLGFGYRLARLIQTTYNDERAVEVRVNDSLIGYIPRKNLADPISYSDTLLMQVLLNEQSGVYYALLSPITPPDTEEINKTSEFCRQHNLEMPSIFDKRVYQMLRYA